MRNWISTEAKLFLTAWLLFAVHFSTNVVREHYPAFSLADHGSLQVDEYQGLHPDIFVHRDGHAYIGNNVTTSVLASVPLLVFKPVLNAVQAYERDREASGGVYQTDKPLRRQFFHQVTERGLALRFGAATLITSVLLIAPLSALCVVAMFWALCGRGVSRDRSLWLALVFGFGTPIFFRTAHLTNNIFVMYFTLAGFLLLWARRDGIPSPSAGARVVAGLCAGMALACDYSGLVVLTCLFGYLVFVRLSHLPLRRALRASLPFVLGAVPPVCFLLYSQWIMYGNPFLPGQYWMPEVNYTDQGWRGFSWPTVQAFLLNLLHPSYGMYVFGPILLLGLIPVLRHRGGPLVLPRPERAFVAVFVLALLLFCAANQYSLMQWNTGFRYLLPLVPLVFLAVADHLVRLPKAALLAVTIPVIVHTWVLCMARDCNPNVDTWRQASSFTAWLGQIGNETVTASYARIWHEGVQLPWLRVMRQTSTVSHPIFLQPWLPAAVLTICGLIVYALWRRGLGESAEETVPAAVLPPGLPTVAVVIPVLNEAHVLEKSVQTLRSYLRDQFPYPAHVVIADNGSTDGTGEIARRLAAEHDDVRVVGLTMRGRGRALRTAWTQNRADIVAYMDVDLSTELPALEKMCRAIHEDGYDIATGSRLLPESQVRRCLKREVLSQGYNLLIKAVLFTHFSDAQCGFKAVSRRVVDEVVPLIQDQAWFFDTELLVLGEKLGYRIKDVPVCWLEDLDSRVKIVSTVWEDIKGVFRLRRLLWSGRLRGMARAQREAAQRPVASTPAMPAMS